MIPTITELDEKRTQIELSYLDEEVTLPEEAKTVVFGGESTAVGYVPIFDADIRRIFVGCFPVPEILEESEGLEGGNE